MSAVRSRFLLCVALCSTAWLPAQRRDPAHALVNARALVHACRGQHGEERAKRIALAAQAYDRIAVTFATRRAVAAQASWRAAELWRRHGSLDLAEQRYLRAALADAQVYGQRALLGAADMQRRQRRLSAAAVTYRRCIAAQPGSARAHDARLWIARMSAQAGKVDAAIAQFQAALEAAPSPMATIETVDHLARAWIAKGDLESAGFCIDHAGDVVGDAGDEDPAVAERLRRAFERMVSRKELQRARDRKNGAAEDAVRLDEYRRRRRG